MKKEVRLKLDDEAEQLFKKYSYSSRASQSLLEDIVRTVDRNQSFMGNFNILVRRRIKKDVIDILTALYTKDEEARDEFWNHVSRFQGCPTDGIRYDKKTNEIYWMGDKLKEQNNDQRTKRSV